MFSLTQHHPQHLFGSTENTYTLSVMPYPTSICIIMAGKLLDHNCLSQGNPLFVYTVVRFSFFKT